jgi:hypothetical protein
LRGEAKLNLFRRLEGFAHAYSALEVAKLLGAKDLGFAS